MFLLPNFCDLWLYRDLRRLPVLDDPQPNCWRNILCHVWNDCCSEFISILCINMRFVCQNYKYEIRRQIIFNILITISRLGCRICSLLTWIQRGTSLCSASQFSSPWWAFSSLRPLILSSFVPLLISTIPKVKASASGVAPVDEEKPRTRHHHNSRDWSDIEGILLTYLLWY